MTTQMPSWPERGLGLNSLGYERALAAAWEARARAMREALIAVSDEARSGYYDGPGLQRFVEIRGLAEDAIELVGPLPTLREGE